MSLLTVNDVAKRMGVSIGLVYKMVNAGQIPYFKFGEKVIRFNEDKINAWIAAQQKTPSPQSS